MPLYDYKCEACEHETSIHKSMRDSQAEESCPACGDIMKRVYGPVAISGTRDSFGIKNAFTDPETGKEIETWKDWENAGYKQLKDARPTRRRRKCNEKIKEKQDKLKGKITV